MKKLLCILLCLMLLAGCAATPVPEPEPEPVGYDGPYYLMSVKDLTLEDLEGKKVALQKYYDSEHSDYFLGQLLSYGVQEEDIVYLGSYQNLPDAIKEGAIDAWIINPRITDVLTDFRPDYENGDYHLIEEINVPYYEEKTIPDSIRNDPLYNEPFAVLLTGIDENVDPNTIKNVRTDVLIFMVVDPVRHHVLTVSFPRDSYIRSATYGYYDKVNAFIQNGMDDLVATIGETLNVEIEYFVQESFKTFVDMINQLGGVWIHVPMDVYMDQDSTRNVKQPYFMDKGYMKVYGEWALALARNRKYNRIAGGDFGRNRNQILIVNEIIARVAKTPEILDMVGMDWLYKLLVYTNFTDDQVKTLIQLGKDFADGYTIDNYFIRCDGDTTEGGAWIAVMRRYSLAIARSKVRLALTGEIDEDDPYLEYVLTGYTSEGAGNYDDGYLGEIYDLCDVYGLDIEHELECETYVD